MEAKHLTHYHQSAVSEAARPEFGYEKTMGYFVFTSM